MVTAAFIVGIALIGLGLWSYSIRKRNGHPNPWGI